VSDYSIFIAGLKSFFHHLSISIFNNNDILIILFIYFSPGFLFFDFFVFLILRDLPLVASLSGFSRSEFRFLPFISFRGGVSCHRDVIITNHVTRVTDIIMTS